ncbi:MAG TPA: sulfatase, partial [Planctomycetota bacterium]|nr:sulfatase [Planctomycetota bacterium]
MRRVVLPLLLAAATACDDPAAPARPPAPAERVILITCDTLRADRLGCYGYDRPVSPNLDAFARQATLYESAWSSAPLTSPALSSLMTGLLPQELGVTDDNRQFMPASVETLAEAVSAAGLPTGAVVSNWVLRRPDPADGDVGLPQGFDEFDDRMTHREANRRKFFDRLAPETADAAIAWLEQRLAADEERFFLWVHFQDPHGPYTAPDEYVQELARPPDDEPPLRLGSSGKGFGQLPKYQALGDERRPSVYRDRYDAEIRYFDEHVGRLLQWLSERGLTDDALIVVTADHGESLGEHDFWFCHGENVHREVVRVPLIVRFPRRAPGAGPAAGARRSELVGHLDLFPTVLAALGLPPRPLRGRSLLEPAAPPGRVLSQGLGAPGDPKEWHGLTDGRWHLVVQAGQPPRLYDLESDAKEQRDVAGEQAQRVAELERL